MHRGYVSAQKCMTLTRSRSCEQVHTAIREDPAAEKKERKKPADAKNWKPKKLTYDERKQKLKVCCSNIKTFEWFKTQ